MPSFNVFLHGAPDLGLEISMNVLQAVHKYIYIVIGVQHTQQIPFLKLRYASSL